ncbi:ABC transporter permease [Tunicatimonas pelagia]|uniref:ABC transporter permease n=1 Tax=Tunicatimonas pelagia TaxID=931531 RepID=UPI0026657CEF|nr:ABC transporter permease [Tunicatimonas pelagia]WKN43713.1 ABC transporter permease [Tunicatimonas pelagia]
MFKNYLRIAIRNLFKNKVYSFINIFGLAIGLTCSILILLWVQDETSYDSFHPKADRLYQVWLQAQWDEDIGSQVALPLPTYEALKSANSHIERVAVSNWGGNHLLAVGEDAIVKEGFFVSEEFLEMFEFPLVQGGERGTLLDDPSSIVITESAAKALFDKEDPIGKVVRVDDKHELQVMGVLEDIPSNSSFEFDFLLPWKLNATFDYVKRYHEENWDNHSWQVYAELTDPTHQAEVENSIRDIVHENGNMDFKRELFLYPLARWRLHSNFEDGKEEGGMIEYVQLFTAIAIFILVIACINFMNLATARSEGRAREVGIRKSVGSHRRELILQFMGEAIFISLLAFLIAILFTELALPFYNNLVDKELFINFSTWQFWIASLVVVLFTGLIAGSYPALYLSSFQPARVLKGTIKAGKGASTPRKVLVTLQFGFSILLIIGAVVIYQQIRLVQNRELGYSQENLIFVEGTDDLKKNYEVLKNELLQSGLVTSMTRSNSPITDVYSNNFLGWPGKPEEQRVIFSTIVAGYDYTKTMGIDVLEGRDFSEDFASDTAAILVNKAGADIMQLDDPIGTQLEFGGEKRTLIGIVDDVLMGSPHQPIEPMMILMGDWGGGYSLRLDKTNNLPGALTQVEDIFNKHNPAYPFKYEFADVEFQKKYTIINLTKSLANLFTVLALVITGLGLFGLASYTAEQRTKEIGIRKVLGASVTSIISLMSRDFSRLVIIAFVISAPIAWWALSQYLERYTVRTDIHWWIFPLTGLAALIFALAFVVTQALRAARTNPAKALRSE